MVCRYTNKRTIKYTLIMKINIHNQTGIQQLKRNQKLIPENLFLIGSESVTNTLYFRRAKDIKYAHKVIIHKLSGILHVVDYLFTPNGWLLLVKLKGAIEIESFYRRMRGLEKDEILKYDVGRIISEVIRTTISSIVSYINRGSNRKGALVYRVFKRFSILSISTAKSLISKMKKKEIILSNQRKQFQPSLKLWNRKILPKIGMIFLSSIEREELVGNAKKEEMIGLKSILIGYDKLIIGSNSLIFNVYFDR